MPAPIFNRVNLADEAGSFVLYDWMADDVQDGRNLMRVDRDGNVLWKASPVDTGGRDCFVHLEWDGQTLLANTFSCYRVSIDPDNGDVTILHFTK